MTTEREEAVAIARGLLTTLALLAVAAGLALIWTSRVATAAWWTGIVLALAAGLLLARIAHVRGVPW